MLGIKNGRRPQLDNTRAGDRGPWPDPLNLMLFTGLPAAGWEAAWYGSFEEIADPGKALARSLRHDRPPEKDT